MNMSSLRVLLVEGIHPRAVEVLEKEGFKVEAHKHSPGEKELSQMLKNFDVLGIRSKTQVPEQIFIDNPQLLTVGAFCIGTDQVNALKANQNGVPVFNAPYSNTRSVAELVIAEIVALSRQLGSSFSSAGQPLKSAALVTKRIGITIFEL